MSERNTRVDLNAWASTVMTAEQRVIRRSSRRTWSALELAMLFALDVSHATNAASEMSIAQQKKLYTDEMMLNAWIALLVTLPCGSTTRRRAKERRLSTQTQGRLDR